MKEVWKKLIRSCIAACGRCHGMGYIEMPNGDTKECHICNGKGVL
jgi:hypothetical protein